MVHPPENNPGSILVIIAKCAPFVLENYFGGTPGVIQSFTCRLKLYFTLLEVLMSTNCGWRQTYTPLSTHNGSSLDWEIQELGLLTGSTSWTSLRYWTSGHCWFYHTSLSVHKTSAWLRPDSALSMSMSNDHPKKMLNWIFEREDTKHLGLHWQMLILTRHCLYFSCLLSPSPIAVFTKFTYWQ